MNNCLFKCRGPSQLAGAPLHFLVGRGIRVGVIPPEHVLAQLGAHGLHLVLASWARLALKKVRPFLFSAIQYVKCGSKKIEERIIYY